MKPDSELEVAGELQAASISHLVVLCDTLSNELELAAGPQAELPSQGERAEIRVIRCR
jgi:hypothetical protein